MNALANHTQRIKNVIHGVQGFAIFIGWAVTIAVFTKPGTSGGGSKYYFALCWLSIPALIYLAAIPTFARTKRFANPYASAVLDGLFTILWLAAFAAVAAWTNQGISKGKPDDDKKDDKDKDKNKSPKKGCDHFGYGNPAKCRLSQATVGFGVVICLLFALTTAISAYSVLHFRKTGSVPGGNGGSGGHVPVDEQTKYAFSSNPHDDFDADAELAGGGHEPPHRNDEEEEDNYDVLHPHPEDEGGGRYDAPPPVGPHYGDPSGGLDDDTSYHGASASSQQHQYSSDPFRNPSPNPSYHSRQPSAGDPFQDDSGHDYGAYGQGGRVGFPDHNDYR